MDLILFFCLLHSLHYVFVVWGMYSSQSSIYLDSIIWESYVRVRSSFLFVKKTSPAAPHPQRASEWEGGDDAISSRRINNNKVTPRMQQLIVLYTYGLRARTLVFTWSNRCAQKSTNIQIQFNSIVILIFRIVKQSTQMLRLHQHRIQISIRQP